MMIGDAPLKNERQELYAKNRAQGMPPSKAAVAAGFSSGSGTYSKMEKDEDVQARIEFLKTELEERKAQRAIANRAAARAVGETVGYTRSWVLQQLAEVAANANSDGDYKEANRALELIGKDMGMFEGGSSPDDEPGDVPQSFDADSLDALKRGWDAIKGGPKIDSDDGMTPEERARIAASIIEGHHGSNRVKPADRVLKTGSETDVALERDDEREPVKPAEDDDE